MCVCVFADDMIFVKFYITRLCYIDSLKFTDMVSNYILMG